MDRDSSPRRIGLLGGAGRLAAVVAVVWLMHLATDWLVGVAEASARSHMLMAWVLAGLILAYALLIALPFVPGIEIGLSLLALRGGEIAPYLYVATVAGLMLAYLAGYLLPHRWLEGALRRVRLVRAADLLAEVATLPPRERLALLQARLPRRAARLALRWRYVVLALLYNMPGSGLVGGGGGISLVAGSSRMFLPWPTFLAIVLAVAPAPLMFWWLGVPGVAD